MTADRLTARVARPSVERPTDHRGRFVPDGSWPPGRGAPEPLERVRRFVNTANPESAGDHFETVESLGAWLDREGYPRRTALTEKDRARVAEVRRALRQLAFTNHDGGRSGDAVRLAQEAVAVLDRVAAECPVVLHIGPSPQLVPTTPGVGGVLASLLAAVYDAMVDGSWLRMKACRNHHCQWVFYDHSRNGSGSWCSLAACGSRMKVRAYRARQRAAAPAIPSAPPTTPDPIRDDR